MQHDSVIALPNPWSTLSDPLTEVLRRGAQQLLAQAVEAEVATLLALYADRHDNQGRKAIVRNGYLPEREVQTGIGSVPVKVPRVRDRSGSGLRFHSMILPPYLRRSPSLETLLPWLYLQGISTGDVSEAWEALWVLMRRVCHRRPLVASKTCGKVNSMSGRGEMYRRNATCMSGWMPCIVKRAWQLRINVSW